MELISVHVPKTAGSTFGNLLTSIYGVAGVFKDYDDYPMNPLMPYLADREAWRAAADLQVRGLGPEFRAVHGHFPIEKYEGIFPQARRIAWVRHPAAWVVSLYYFWKNRAIVPNIPTNPLILRLLRDGISLAEFAEDPSVRDVVSRVYLGGLPLAEYDFVGVQEHFDDDLADLIHLMGWPELPPGRENRNPEPGYSDRLDEALDDPALVDRMAELNGRDMALYEEALRLRSARLRRVSLTYPARLEASAA